MDILGPLPTTSSGNRYLLVIVDCFSKWVKTFPLKKIRAKTVAEVFLNQVVFRHGVPLKVHTDQGRNFESKVFAELMEILGISKTRTTALHPQSDGQVERQHPTITNYLAKYISSNQKDWDCWVPMFFFYPIGLLNMKQLVELLRKFILVGIYNYLWICYEDVPLILKVRNSFRLNVITEIFS